MKRTAKQWMRAGTVVLVLTGLVAGCSAIRKDEAQSAENLLVAAGFKAKPADTPEKVAQLKSLPALKMQVRSKDGKLGYSYADPYNCKCLYVGGPSQYAEYKRLAIKQQIATDQVEAAEAEENASLDWGMWGGFGPWGY
jgi:hypothetical protein